MRFHYWKSLLSVFFLAFLIWITFASLLPIDPLTLARSFNREIATYLADAQVSLKTGQKATEPNVPIWIKTARENVDAALVVANDQSTTLQQIAEAKLGPDVQTIGATLASFLAILGTFSTVILSWRKDMREARTEIELLQSKAPKIQLPYK